MINKIIQQTDLRDQVMKYLVINSFSDFHIKHLAPVRHRARVLQTIGSLNGNKLRAGEYLPRTLTLPTLGTLRRLEMTNVAWARLISLWRGTQAALHNQATHHSAIPYGNKNTHSLNSQYYNCLTETYRTDIADRL